MSEALWTELEKTDVIRERFAVTYDEARYALSIAEGDLMEALAWLEREDYKQRSDFAGEGTEMWNGFKTKLSGLKHTQVALKHNGNTLLSFSAPVGIGLGYALWSRKTTRFLGLLGIAAAAATKCDWEVDAAERTNSGAADPV